MLRLILCALLLLATPAWAITVTQTGASFDVEYDEPTLNSNGTPLTDLDHSNVYFKVGTAAEVKGPNVPASKLTGGGHIKATVTVPVVEGVEVDVALSATATDQAGNESGRSLSITRRVDRLPPAAPR